jgi:hypothetical protein
MSILKGNTEKKAQWSCTYTGSVQVERGPGISIVTKAVASLTEPGAAAVVACACTVFMNEHRVRVVEAQHGNLLETHFMRSISSTAVVGDGDNMVHIGIVSKHPVLQTRVCSLFQCSRVQATDIASSIEDAFQELIGAANPFAAPEGQQLIQPPPSLAASEIRRHFLVSTGVAGVSPTHTTPPL